MSETTISLPPAAELDIVDAEIIAYPLTTKPAEQGISVYSPDEIREFLHAVSGNPVLFGVAANAVAREIYGSKISTEIAVQPKYEVQIVATKRPQLVSRPKPGGQRVTNYKPFVSPLKDLARDSFFAFLDVVETAEEANRQFGKFDITPYYVKAFDITKTGVAKAIKTVSKAKPIVSQTVARVESKVDKMSLEKRRRLVRTALVSVAFTGVVSGNFALDASTRASNELKTPETNVTQTTSLINQSKDSDSKVGNVVITGDLKND